MDGYCCWAVASCRCLASPRVRVFVRVLVSLCLCVCLLCGAVSCRVSRVVARYFLFVVRHWSLVVLRCDVLCCCVLLYVVVLCEFVCVGGRGGEAGERKGCMHRTRLRVYVQNVFMCTDTTRTCFNTRARGAGTQEDVLNVHT